MDGPQIEERENEQVEIDGETDDLPARKKTNVLAVFFQVAEQDEAQPGAGADVEDNADEKRRHLDAEERHRRENGSVRSRGYVVKREKPDDNKDGR